MKGDETQRVSRYASKESTPTQLFVYLHAFLVEACLCLFQMVERNETEQFINHQNPIVDVSAFNMYLRQRPSNKVTCGAKLQANDKPIYCATKLEAGTR